MTHLAINLTLVEYIVFPIVAIIFGVTLYFFIKSRRTLKETLGSDKLSSLKHLSEKEPIPYKRSRVDELEEEYLKMRYETPAPPKREPEVYTKKPVVREENIVEDLKNTIASQQKMLNSYLDKVEELEKEGRQELREQNNQLQKEIEKLHSVIEKKDEEIEDLFQQARANQKLTAKIEEVYQEFDQLQTKLQSLEKQASKANSLAMELEDARQSYEQLHKELIRKQEKLEEVLNENHRMKQDMDMLEDKLSEANLQRQQLQKKVQFLQELNTDMQGISETNKKLQTELRRIGELESMLNLMAEERDYLLRKKLGK